MGSPKTSDERPPRLFERNKKMHKVIEREAMKLLERCRFIEPIFHSLCKIGYFTVPASTKHHLSCRSGLAAHSINVTQNLLSISNAMNIDWPRVESPYIVGMLHDLVKCYCYDWIDGGWKYDQPYYPGHGIASVMIANKIGIALLKKEIMAITYHMGTFNIGKEYTKEEFDAALKSDCGRCILATHYADWAASNKEPQTFEEVN